MGVMTIPEVPMWICDRGGCQRTVLGDPFHPESPPHGWFRGDVENSQGLGGNWVACKATHIQGAVHTALTPDKDIS